MRSIANRLNTSLVRVCHMPPLHCGHNNCTAPNTAFTTMTAGRPAAAASASVASAASRILLRKWSPDATTATTSSASSSAFANTSTTFESIRREAWEVAYSHIYSADEVGRYFGGEVKEGRTWPSIPCQHEETLVCEVQPLPQQLSSTAICAYAKWGWTPHAQAELHSLYVSPSCWNRGCGSMLWDAIMTKCRTEQVQSMDIWVLKAARSGEFYAARGCKCVAEGDYFIGDKRETALCYRWKP